MVGSPCSPRDSQEFSPTPQFKSINFSVLIFIVQLSHPYMATGKTTALTRWTSVGKGMSLLLNMLSRLILTFLPRSKHFFNFMVAVTMCSDFGAQENKVGRYFPCVPNICHEVMGPDAMILVFCMLSFKPAFSLSLSLRGSSVPLCFVP